MDGEREMIREQMIRVYTEYIANWFALVEPERSQRLAEWRETMREGKPLEPLWDQENRLKFERQMEQKYGDVWLEYRKAVRNDD